MKIWFSLLAEHLLQNFIQLQKCEDVPGRKWQLGAYKCECRQGFEFPFGDERSWYFDGLTLHDQHMKMLAGKDNMFKYITYMIL